MWLPTTPGVPTLLMLTSMDLDLLVLLVSMPVSVMLPVVLPAAIVIEFADAE